MADTWRIERRIYDPDLEVWGSWSAIETEIEIDPVGGEYTYEDSGSFTNDITYQYRVRHVGDQSDWLESNEIIYSYGAGGAEAGITIAAEGEGVRFASGGAEVGISLAAEGSGIKISTGGAETWITIDAEGKGVRYAEGGAEAVITVLPEGAGYKRGAGGAEATITITPEGAGEKHAAGGAGATITITSEGQGIKISSGGAETRIVIGAEGWGFRYRRVIITLSVEERSKSLSIQERDVKLEVE
jgi:hypothetical protein